MIFGIIIDTFADLRDQVKDRNTDMNTVCFVCGNERKDFEAKNKSFENHIKNEHDPFIYVHYLTYLTNKNVTDLNGIELWVYENMLTNALDWIPIENTEFLKEDYEEDVQEKFFEEQTETSNKIISGLRKVDCKIEAIFKHLGLNNSNLNDNQKPLKNQKLAKK